MATRFRATTAIAAASLLLALAAMLFLTFWTGFYEGETFDLDADRSVRTSASLIDENGLRILWVLSFPVSVAAVGLALSFRRTMAGKISLWVSAAILALFALATALSIGPFYFPAAGALIIAAIAHLRAKQS